MVEQTLDHQQQAARELMVVETVAETMERKLQVLQTQAVAVVALVLVHRLLEAQAALVLSSSKSQIRIAQSLPEQLSATTLQTLTTHNP